MGSYKVPGLVGAARKVLLVRVASLGPLGQVEVLLEVAVGDGDGHRIRRLRTSRVVDVLTLK